MSWRGVDLDGTLAFYPPPPGMEIGPPIPRMLTRVKQWLAAGEEVRIVTARVSGGPLQAEEVVRQRALVQAWCVEHLGCSLQVTCRKDYGMSELWDNAAVQVVTNTGQRVDGCSD